MFDLSAKRELNNGFGNSLSVAVELVVSPLMLGALGWKIDDWAGTSPLFALVLFAFTLGYVVWKQYTLYERTMASKEQELLGPKHDRGMA